MESMIMNAPMVMEGASAGTTMVMGEASVNLNMSTNNTTQLEEDQRSLNTPINVETMEATAEVDEELDTILNEALDHMERLGHEEEFAKQLTDHEWTLD